jgi:ribosomal-protein-alanine N-acetyltransferase
MDPVDAASMALVSALHLRCFSASGADKTSSREGGGWSSQDLFRILASPGGFGFIAGGATVSAELETADEGSSPLGFILCRMAGEDCEVLTFGVDPKVRGAGLGSSLLEAAMICAKAMEATRMILEVALDNEPALDLYDKMGFREIGRRNAYYSPLPGDIAPTCHRTAAKVLGLSFD